METLDRYRKRVGLNKPNAAKNPFIEMSLNKISIQKYVSGEIYNQEYDAVLIFRDKEGPDNGILYTYKKDGLDVGDSLVKKGSNEDTNAYYLITEEVKRVDGSEVIRVFNVLETNVLFETRDSRKKRPAYLTSNLKNLSGGKGSSSDGIVLEIKKAIMVAPKDYSIKINQKLNMENLITGDESYASWLIEGIDDISTPNINYIYLKQVLKEDFDDQPPQTPNEGVQEVDALSAITLETTNGFIKTEPMAVIMDRTTDRVIVRVPLNSDTLKIITKNKEGKEVINNYTIRG